METNFAEKRTALDALARKILRGSIPTAREWGGADVVISVARRTGPRSTFYPEPRRVVTPNAPQLSWLFIQLRDVFSGLYDGCSKIELFGRLANAALRYQAKNPGGESQRDILAAVLHEGHAILDEMEEETFEAFTLAFGNTVADDLTDEVERVGFVDVDTTRKFFAERGINL